MALLETNGKSKISVIHSPACITGTSMLCPACITGTSMLCSDVPISGISVYQNQVIFLFCLSLCGLIGEGLQWVKIFIKFYAFSQVKNPITECDNSNLK